MYQGETITTEIHCLPVPASEIKDLRIIFKNYSRTILEKTLDDCHITTESVEGTDETREIISVRLTQEETLRFPVGSIQRSVIVVTKDGSRFELDPCTMQCGATAKKEVLT